ncbi:MAG TPA: DUF3788 domain-containing protein [Edaphobacter sp.]|nr:DUF3788 domain-containing protein [Edaphobacter sp.]
MTERLLDGKSFRVKVRSAGSSVRLTEKESPLLSQRFVRNGVTIPPVAAIELGTEAAMEPVNAFIGKADKPTTVEVAKVLGQTETLWANLIHWAAEELGVKEQEWKGIYVHKYGWSLRLKKKGRNIIYLSPCEGCFRVSFVLSEKAMAKVRNDHFPAGVAKIIAEAPKYPEGTGIVLTSHSEKDLEPIQKLAAIKAAN